MHVHKRNILIIRFSSIGDILLTTPFVRQVRLSFPEAHITYIVKKEYSDLVNYNPFIDSVIAFDSAEGLKGLADIVKNLPEQDLIFDLHNNLRSNRITSHYKKAKVFKIHKNRFKRTLLIYLKINLYNEIVTAPQKYLNTATALGVKDNGEKLEVFWNGKIGTSIENLLQGNALEFRRYICIAPGAVHYTKRWPLENVVKVIDKILATSNIKIVIIGGPAESNLINEFNDNKKVINLAGRLSLLETAGVIKNSKGIITNDSGLMHMATAVNQSVIAIFGSTTEELGFFPFRADAQVIQNNGIWCRPCSHIGKSFCPLGHFNCMKSISSEHVYNHAAGKFLI